MPTSDNRHPSRDAVMRDALNQLREQHGVSLEDFAFHLNALVHGMCPSKVADQSALSSFSQVNSESSRAIGAWTKKTQRWANGETEFPAWLEEAWVTTLEEFGDSSTREILTYRHGYLAIPIPTAMTSTQHVICGFKLNAQAHSEFGAVGFLMAKMLEDGRLDFRDRPLALPALKEIKDAIGALTQLERVITTQVLGETVQ